MDETREQYLIRILNCYWNSLDTISIRAGGETFSGTVVDISGHTVALNSTATVGGQFWEITLESIVAVGIIKS